MTTLFRNRSSQVAFWGLLTGFLVILFASVFLFSLYSTYEHFHTTDKQLAVKFVKTVRLARAIPPRRLRFHVRALRERFIFVGIKDQPAEKGISVDTDRPKQLHEIAMENYPKFIANVPLSNGRWLVVNVNVPQHPWLMVGIIGSSILLLVALLSLIYFVIQSISLPAKRFIQAAKSFGVDVQSPPMAVEGTPEVQAVIKAFNEMQGRIRRLLHDRTQMLAAISHDLRTPITRLQLRAEYLKDTEQYEKAVADLNEMEKMIASILSFARDYASSEAMEKFDLSALLESICDDMIDTGSTASYQTTEGRVPVLGRLTALKRAFTNLIENAIKYGKEATVELTVNDTQVTIKVSDKGPGIPASEQENVFAPFYRVDPSRSPQTSGSGLGLAVARDIIRTHGGDISLRNLESAGLAVIVTLPKAVLTGDSR